MNETDEIRYYNDLPDRLVSLKNDQHRLRAQSIKSTSSGKIIRDKTDVRLIRAQRCAITCEQLVE